jgi:galactokinase
MDFEIIEYIDFVMGFLTCMAIALTMYLVMTRKKKRK